MKIFAGLIIIIFLCATLLILIPDIGTPKPVMVAEKLSNKPEEYFVVTDADPVLLQAISHLGESVRFNSLDETEIDDLRDQYGTSNIEYQNNYYWAGFPIGEPLQIYSQILWISLFGLGVSITLLVSLAILKGLGRRKHKETDKSKIFAGLTIIMVVCATIMISIIIWGNFVSFLFFTLMWISLIGFVVSTILLISLAIIKVLGQGKRKKQQPQAVN